MPKRKPQSQSAQESSNSRESDISKPKAKIVHRRNNLPVKPPKVRRIIKILRDQETLDKIQDLAENGASLSTIDAILKYPPNTMSNLLHKGRTVQSKSDPYYKFFILFRSWVGESRAQAELILAKKSPEKWLDRNSSNKLLESEEDAKLALNAPSNPTQAPSPGVEAKNVLKSLQILREQGISLDDVFDKGDISLIGVDKDDD